MPFTPVFDDNLANHLANIEGMNANFDKFNRMRNPLSLQDKIALGVAKERMGKKIIDNLNNSRY